jgi:hypothetical protein
MGVVRGTRDQFMSRQVISFFPGCAGQILSTPGLPRIKLVSGVVFGDCKVLGLDCNISATAPALLASTSNRRFSDKMKLEITGLRIVIFSITRDMVRPLFA